jgi:hypothetical protein
MFEVLRNRRRRYVVHHLRSLGPTERTTLPELASHVAAWEQGVEVDAVTYEDRKSVQTALLQCHLPKLEEKGVLEFDPKTKSVRRTDGTHQIDLFLETVSEDEVSWSLILLSVSGLATLWAVLLAGGVIGPPFFPAAGWLVVSAAVFLVTAAAFVCDHYCRNRVRTSGDPSADVAGPVFADED